MKTSQTKDDITAQISTACFSSVDYESHNVCVYRHDHTGKLCDVTDGKFCSMANLNLTNDEMAARSVATDADRMKGILRKCQTAMNRLLVSNGIVSNASKGIPVFDAPLLSEDANLKEVMHQILERHKLDARALAVIRDLGDDATDQSSQDQNDTLTDTSEKPFQNFNLYEMC